MPVIDIHAHYVSPELIREASRNGAHYGVAVRGGAEGREELVIAGTAPLRPVFEDLCDLAVRLPWLEEQGIDRQVISTWTDLAGDELARDQAARWSRLQNETMAQAARAMPERFEAMGTLPMQYPDLAVAELDHIVKRLGMRSVEIGTNINGVDLDDEAFRPVWRRLADLDVFVLLHPSRTPAGAERMEDYFLNNLVGYPLDTTIAAGRLLFSGILRDFPSLKCCLAHGGGFVPYQIGRFDRGFAAHPACRSRIAQTPSQFLRAFYYDSLTHRTAVLGYLAAAVGADRVLYGSDYPFEMLDPAGPQRVRQAAGLGTDEIAAILCGNAIRALGPVPERAIDLTRAGEVS